MSASPKPTSQEIFQRAAPLLTERQADESGPLEDSQRTLLQDATLAIVAELKLGRNIVDIEEQMVDAGWQAEKAVGFIRLVSQLLSKMYFQRTCIFGGLTFFTAMLASIAVPVAQAGDFPGYGAGLAVGVAILSMLGLLRNMQLWRKFRQPRQS